MALENAAQKKARETQEAADLLLTGSTTSATGSTPTIEEEEEIIEEIVAAVAVASKVKLVNVMGTEDHDCTIANVRYLIEHRKTQRVPEDVAMILQNSGVAIRTN